PSGWRCLAIVSTTSAVTPNAAVNHTELAQSSIRRPYQPSNSALLRGEKSRTTDRSAIASAGLGVSPIAPALAAASSGSVFTSFPYSKYCFAVAGSATRCPQFVRPRKPAAREVVEPVHTPAGSVLPLRRSRNLLCGILVRDRRKAVFWSLTGRPAVCMAVSLGCPGASLVS